MKLLHKLMYILLFTTISCSSNSNLVQDGDVYLFQGKEQIIISFTTTPSQEILTDTGKAILFLSKKNPSPLSEDESVLIEGLSTDSFSDFFTIASYLFSATEEFKNTTLMYSYIASLYQEFYKKSAPYIAISEFQNFVSDKKVNTKENETLLKSTVDFSVKNIFFISLLELMERPQRYFYPQKTKDELFRILIYSEIVTFWNYMTFRFGESTVLNYAKQEYSDSSWQEAFGEPLNETEGAYVKSLKDSHLESSILSIEQHYTDLTNSLELYMTGTKKSLMKE